MKEMDDIEQLFASSFDGAEVTPPVKVKTAVDKALFGGNKIIGLRLISLLILALLVGLGILFIPDWSPASSNQQLDIAEQKTNNHQSNNNSDNQPQIVFNKAEESEQVNETTITKDEEKLYNTNSQFNSLLYSSIETNSIEAKSSIVQSKKEKSNVDNKEIDLTSSLSEISTTNEYDVSQTKNSEENTLITFSNLSEENLNIETDISGLQTRKLGLFSFEPNDLMMGNYPAIQNPSLVSGISLSLYSGVTGAYNQLNSTVNTFASSNLSMKELNGYTFAVEASSQIFGQFGIATGVQYSTRNDYLIDAVSVSDTNLVSAVWEYVYLNPQIQDTIIDSNYVETYNVTQNTIENESIIKSVSISIPIYFTFEKAIGSHLSLMVSAGARLSYLNLKTVNENILVPTPNYSKFGLSLLFRPELRYDFNRFGIGFYGTSGYNAITGMSWETFSRRRYEFGGGIVLRYKL